PPLEPPGAVRRANRAPSPRIRAAIPLLALSLALMGSLYHGAASAGMSYQLDTAQASPGETVRIKGMLFNDTDNALSWTPPQNLVLQWRNEQGRVIRSLAYLETPAQQVELPINNFAAFSWKAVVPTEAKGLQALNIEGESVLLALDTSPSQESQVAGTPALTPIVDAGAAAPGATQDPPLPDSVVAAAGANAEQGPRPAAPA